MSPLPNIHTNTLITELARIEVEQHDGEECVPLESRGVISQQALVLTTPHKHPPSSLQRKDVNFLRISIHPNFGLSEFPVYYIKTCKCKTLVWTNLR